MVYIAKIGVIIGKFLVGLIAFILLYLIGEFLLSRVTVAAVNKIEEPKEVDVFLLSNGVHMDVVMPIRNTHIDWSLEIDPRDTKSQRSDMAYLAVGWGDKGFYLDTPEWKDLKFSVAFKAAFYLGSSAMHTTFYKDMYEGDNCVRVRLSAKQYLDLIHYIRTSFLRDSFGKPILIRASTYGVDDSFYEAKGTYGLFYTCNTWVNNALKSSGLRACLWTASDRGILYQYKKKFSN